jgi:protein-disulfide isomerase-like protein with CxxC motif
VNLAVGIIIFALIVVAWSQLVRLYLPDPSCRWCQGRGTRWGSNRKRSGPCFFCKGTGKRKGKSR